MSRRLETLFKYSHIKIQDGSSLWQTAQLKSISVHRQVREKKRKKKLNDFFPPPKHRNSKAKKWNTFLGQLVDFFFGGGGMKSSDGTVQMRTIYQVTASHYCVPARVASGLWLFRTCVSTAVSNDMDGTTDRRSQVGSTREVPGSYLIKGSSYADVRTVVDIHTAKATRQAM